MERQQDVEFDMKLHKTVGAVAAALDRAGGLPVVVLPLDTDRKSMAAGRGCLTIEQLYDALRWAYKLSPDRLARIIPANVAT